MANIFKIKDEIWRIEPCHYNGIPGIIPDYNFELRWKHVPTGVWYTYYAYETEVQAVAVLEDIAKGRGVGLVMDSVEV